MSLNNPLCPICGSAHNSRDGHTWKGVPELKAVNKSANKAPAVNTVVNIPLAEHERIVGELKARIARLEGGKVDRKIYMREYMQKRRKGFHGK